MRSTIGAAEILIEKATALLHTAGLSSSWVPANRSPKEKIVRVLDIE